MALLFPKIFLSVILFLPFIFGVPLQDTSAEDDKIASLPGTTFEIKFNQYSGYLNVGTDKKYHYWFLESQRDPEKDPLVLWLNGGPGCSSLLGLMGENGPFRVDWKGENIGENVHAWNKLANVVYLESPSGVGFSYGGNSQYNDSLVAIENHLALLSFAAKFPAFKNRNFFVSGESYGGVYIPTLAVEILKDKHFPFDFQGVAIGNGIYDFELNFDTSIDYFFYHGLFGDDLMLSLRKACNCTEYFCNYELSSNFDFASYPPSPLNECGNKLSDAADSSAGLDRYNIYDSCYDNSTKKEFGPKISHMVPSQYSVGLNLVNPIKYPGHCRLSYDTLEKYLNDARVRKALHIPDSVQQWTSCWGFHPYNNNLLVHTMVAQFVTMLKSRISILIYHGDFDTACNFFEGQQFLRNEKLGLKLDYGRRRWTYSSDIFPIAGFWDKFEQNIDFLTVRGAGHFVPADKPREALQMIGNFLAGTRDYSKAVKTN